MSQLVRLNPDTPCPHSGVHHPHRWHCTDPACNWGAPCGYTPLICCACSQEWPCEERQHRDNERNTASTGKTKI